MIFLINFFDELSATYGGQVILPRRTYCRNDGQVPRSRLYRHWPQTVQKKTARYATLTVVSPGTRFGITNGTTQQRRLVGIPCLGRSRVLVCGGTEGIIRVVVARQPAL